MKTTFTKWLAKVAADQITVDSSNIDKESHSNHWSFSISSAEAAVCDSLGIEQFITSVIDCRCASLLAQNAELKSMLFYCWHDEMASQIRFSMISASHDRMPFGGTIQIEPELSQITASFLHSLHHDGIPFSELVECDFDTSPKESPRIQKVWTKLIP
jgi:hypothetical protein